jgi:hypothetical protein
VFNGNDNTITIMCVQCYDKCADGDNLYDASCSVCKQGSANITKANIFSQNEYRNNYIKIGELEYDVSTQKIKYKDFGLIYS